MTRLMWVVVFALLVGALLLLMVRSVRPGAGPNQLLADIQRTHDSLAARYPEAEFMVRSAVPRPGVRNLVVFIVPGPADSAAQEPMADSALALSGRLFGQPGFDSLIVALNGVAVRARALR